jgi:hypothetical protein
MEHEKKVALEDRREALESDVPEAAAVLGVLQRAGLELTSARRTDGRGDSLVPARRSWLARLKLPEALAQSFTLAPEILVIFTPFDELHMKVIDAAERELAASRRLDRSVVLCFTEDQRAEQRAAPTLPDLRTYLFVHFSRALAVVDPQRWMRELLRDAFMPARLFAPGRLSTGWDFLGREEELRELGRMLLGDGRPAGVFGLRRMGKTSLIRHWADSLLEVQDGALPEAILLWIDLNAVGFSEKNVAGLFRLLIKVGQGWRSDTGITSHHLAMRPWARVDANDRTLSATKLQQMGELAIDDLLHFGITHRRRLVLVLDEYEQLLEPTGISGGLTFLAWIRGLYQQNPRNFCFVVAGLDRAWLRKPRLHGRQNPLLGVVKDMPLAGLSRESLGALVRRIAGRAQLHFDHKAIDVIYAESGGHPYLARQICDLIDQRIPPIERLPARVGAARVEAVFPRFDRENNDLMPEFLSAAESLGGVTAEQLASLAAGSDKTGIDDVAMEDLESYGILTRTKDGRWIHRIGALARWLRANYDVPLMAAGGAQ